LRVLCLILLIGAAITTIVVVFPLCGDRRRLRLKRAWSRALLAALAVDLEADLRHAPPAALLVANHISWLDIFVINAVLPAAFVAKAEVCRWPLIGWLAAQNDTVFLRRGSRGHARMINAELASLLTGGKHVAVFPEGTTSDGLRLLTFHAALLQPALAAGRPVIPVAISYWEPGGGRCLAPRYDGDISLWESLLAILRTRRIVVRLVTAAPAGTNGTDRRAVAAHAHAAIALAAGLPPASNRPGTPGGPPGGLPSGVRPTGIPSQAPAGWE
jgi:1-acyl-sn-glycerol-3-phosphate acyltransferase